MAFGAGMRVQVVRVAVATGTRPAVVQVEAVRPVELGWQPGCGGVAALAIQAEQPSMVSRVAVAGGADCRQALECYPIRAVGMAAVAGQVRMGASEREFGRVVVEGGR